ncbi:sphingosine N-acyltransferase [Malassezia brasiliensis]|uniref:Sphingosine N-acyltransferase n=1 Tax=Malassezia brasiliensis TaxID=1821822 RepID=A0AAF0DQZ7_9BASI|nr:sphingosine N-acyltransferase [Malassezia brasiliensis]
MAHVCSRVHSATHACLFLSGGTDSATGKVHNGLASAWNWAGHVFGKTSASDVAYTPSVLYKRDPRDVLFAVTWGIVLLALRGVLMSTLLLPVARRLVKRPLPEKGLQAGHLRKYHRSIDRFAEQFWICILYATSLALVVPFWLWNPEQLWIGYPHTTMDGLTKAVYLWEASNYIHQLFVINIEARRSDYLQMTLAKMLKYMGWQTTCDAMFGAFMISWTITRHICYMFVMMTCIYDAPRLIPYRSPVDLRTGYAFTPVVYVVFITLLAVLQSILLVWFGMILKVTYRVLTNAGAIDSRSDDDSD